MRDLTEPPPPFSDTQQLYKAVFEASRDAVLILYEGRFIDCNPAAVRLFGVQDKEVLLNTHPYDFSPSVQPDGTPSEEAAEQRINEALEHGSALFEWLHCTADGQEFLSEVLLSRVDTESSTVIQGVVRNITARRRIEQELKLSNKQAEHFRALVEDAIDHSSLGLFILDDHFRTVWASRSVKKFLGVDPATIIGCDLCEVFEDQVVPRIPEGVEFTKAIRQAYEGGVPLESRICHVQSYDGFQERWLEHQSFPIESGSYAGGRIEIFLDQTARKALEDELAHRASHDYLTGLINRQQFENLLDEEINRERQHNIPFSLIMVDVDRFKAVNDKLGHDVGDRALKAIATVSRNHIRAADSVSRWGGEEFMVLLPGCDAANAFLTAESLRELIHRTSVEPSVEELTISAGVTQYRSGETRRELLKRLDDALYEAKQQGRNRVVTA